VSMAGHLIGTHAVANGGIDMAVRRAANAGMSAVQVFTTIPKFYGDKASIRADRVDRFQRALADTGIRPEHVLVHAAYVLNPASEDDGKWGRSVAAMAKEMERSHALGAGGVCFHPGSCPRTGPEEAAKRVAGAMAQALLDVPGATRLYVENSAGAGNTFGKNAEEVGLILAQLPEELRGRAGYGLDTCHLFVSGYDVESSAATQRAVIDEFEAATGEPPAFFHLNDSVGTLGSNLDRHALLGEGQIGADPFRWLLSDARTRGIPLVLETPHEHRDVADDDPSGDPFDLRMMALLRNLGAEA
jgi:deoxyribonuclease-4